MREKHFKNFVTSLTWPNIGVLPSKSFILPNFILPIPHEWYSSDNFWSNSLVKISIHSILNQNRTTFLLIYRYNLINSESLSGRAKSILRIKIIFCLISNTVLNLKCQRIIVSKHVKSPIHHGNIQSKQLKWPSSEVKVKEL